MEIENPFPLQKIHGEHDRIQDANDEQTDRIVRGVSHESGQQAKRQERQYKFGPPREK